MTLNIAIVGAGRVGYAMGQSLLEKGHIVRFGIRNPDKLQEKLAPFKGRGTATSIPEAVDGVDLVVLAVPYEGILDVIQQGGDWSGKTLVDCSNPIEWGPSGPQQAHTEQGSAAETIQSQVPEAHVVKAFNTIGSDFLRDPISDGAPVDTFVLGNHEEAVASVKALATAIGLHPIDGGPLKNAALIEEMATQWIRIAMAIGKGRRIAFKLTGMGDSLV